MYKFGRASLVITRHPGLGRGAYAASVSGSFSTVTSCSGTIGVSVSIASISRKAVRRNRRAAPAQRMPPHSDAAKLLRRDMRRVIAGSPSVVPPYACIIGSRGLLTVVWGIG